MTRKGYWKGKKRSKETKEKISKSVKGDKNPAWKGGRITRNGGYVYIYCPTHPYATKQGYVAEHRLVMEKHIGRVLLPTEVVHHIDNDIQNNLIKNLMLFEDNAVHVSFHEKRKKDHGK